MDDPWWRRAQDYERHYTDQYMQEHGDRLPPKGFSEFYRDASQDLRTQLDEHVKTRTCLEVGCSAFPIITGWDAARRVLVEPSLNEFAGRMFIPDGVEPIALPGEEALPAWRGKVDGAVVARNCIDHTVDPMVLFDLILACAAPGCWLLHWSDIWHFPAPDEGHRNITTDRDDMRRFVISRGFEILHEFVLRPSDDPDGLDWGCTARKL